jgi:hypothetical protein
MIEFLSGAVTMGFLVAAGFFARFWRDTGDRLFGFFAAGFAVFAVNRLLLTVLDDDSEGRTVLYLMRAAAFAMIAVAIIDKNRPRRSD